MAEAVQAAESKKEQRMERETHETPAWHKANPLLTPEARVTWYPVSI